MTRRSLLGACALGLISVSLGVASGLQQEWHTRPDRWTAPRNFHSPLRPPYDNYLAVTHQALGADSDTTKVFSPNKAYWFESPGPLSSGFTPRTPIRIFNERTYLIRIAPTKDDPDYRVMRLEWINEKLVYIEIWWGRVLGTCYIFDVERESMLYREMVNDGSLPFQQWKGR